MLLSRSRTEAGVVVAVYLVAFMALLDVTIVIIALPALRSGLGASTADLQWVVSSYSLCLSTLALSAGALGDRYGRKRMFLIGVALFTAGSGLSAVAPSAPMLLAGRFVQGIGAAITVPGTLALLTSAFPDPARRARVLGGWGSVASLAGVAGPVLGGVLIQAFGWPAIFVVNLPLGMIALVVGARCLPESADPAHAGLDLAGQVLGIIGLGALAYGLISAAGGWLRPPVLVAFGVAVLALVLFWIVERRQATPMLPVRLFTDRRLGTANLASFALGFTAFTLLVFLPTYLQEAAHHPPALTGFLLLPWPIAGAVLSHLAGRWSAHVGPRIPMATGLGLLVLAGIGLLAVRPDTGYPLPALVFALFGSGVGLTFTPSNAAVLAAVDRTRAGTAAATVNAARQTGTSLGVAVLGLLFYRPDLTAGLHRVAIVAAVVAAVVALRALTVRVWQHPDHER